MRLGKRRSDLILPAITFFVGFFVGCLVGYGVVSMVIQLRDFQIRDAERSYYQGGVDR